VLFNLCFSETEMQLEEEGSSESNSIIQSGKKSY
jgi:hypothetical protein